MSLESKLVWLCIGLFVGSVLGYIVRLLQEILETERKSLKHSAMMKKRRVSIQGLALFLVVAITVIAAFRSQESSNDSAKSQHQIEKISVCNQDFIKKITVALNARTTFSSSQATANVALQRAQINFLETVFATTPPTPDAARAAIDQYIEALTVFLQIADSNANAIKTNPYPTLQDFNDCLKLKE